MLSYLLSPRFSVDPAATRNPELFRPKVKWYITFPEWLEEAFRPMDDRGIRAAQSCLSPVTHLFARAVGYFFSPEFASFAPFLLFFFGHDQAAIFALSHALVLIFSTQLSKRFIFRFRPYMKDRAKMGTSVKSSSLPSRAVLCGVVFTYAALRGYLLFYKNDTATSDKEDVSVPVSLSFYLMGFTLICLAALATSFSRILMGAHYPTDCIASVLLGAIACALGDWLYHIITCTESHDGDKALKFTHWSWRNLQWMSIILWSLAGLGLVLIGTLKPVLLWAKLPFITGILLPSILLVRLVCPTENLDLNGTGPLVLGNQVLLGKQVIVAVLLCIGIMAAYRFIKHSLGKSPFGKIFIFASVYLVLLLFILIHRLESSPDDTGAHDARS